MQVRTAMPETAATILIVDDDPGIRQSFSDYLEDRDYRVMTAENGVIGLQTFIKVMPSLVLLDLRMPEMGGIELLRRIRAITADIPLVVVSGTGRISDAIEAIRRGAWDYLLKPIEDLSVLTHTVEKSLERANLRRQNRVYQENLECLVQQRTKELEQANNSLSHLNARLRKIVSTTSSLSSWLNIEEFGVRLLEEFAQHMGATGGSLYLVEPMGLRLVHAVDPAHAPARIPLPLPENSILHRVITENKPSLINAVGESNEQQGSGWNGYRDGSALVFPIQDKQGSVIALLTLHNKRSPPFVEQDKEIGSILASYTCESLHSIRTFEALSESEQRFRELADMLPQTICETDRAGMITYANQQAFESFGYTWDDLQAGLTVCHLFESHECDRVKRNTGSILLDGIAHSIGTEYTAVRKDGSSFPALVYSAPILRGAEHIGMRMVAVDITERKQQEELILHQAHFDSLTELPNRFLVLDRLNQFIKESQRTGNRVAVLFLDLDDFKKVNDTLGHAMGDQLLIETAQRLRKTVRDYDVVGRLGGDEFIVVLGGLVQAIDAGQVAETLLNRFKQAFQLDNRELLMTSSLGIAIYPDDGDTPAELLRKADTAMYYAKAQGRNTYQYYTASMNRDVSRRLLLEQHLHGALKNGEFSLHYQPLVEISGRTVISFEALLRWQNPVLGDISPAEFIPIAEKTGLIIPIGQFVLGEALQHLAYWQDRHGQVFKLAVNLSPRQFGDPQLLQQIKNAIGLAGVPYDSLEFEITEGVLMSGQSYIGDTLVALSRLGINIAMDDFGTGYSSLNYLRCYPFNILKIDRSFIHDITEDPRDRELVNAAIAMAHGLGLKVIAEGVETEEQFDYLARQGCDFAQGYLFSKPKTAEEIDALLEHSLPI